jgi:hypothetical protein
MLLHLKISLLAIFVLLTLLGMASSSITTLLIGVSALFVSLAVAIVTSGLVEPRHDRELHSSF